MTEYISARTEAKDCTGDKSLIAKRWLSTFNSVLSCSRLYHPHWEMNHKFHTCTTLHTFRCVDKYTDTHLCICICILHISAIPTGQGLLCKVKQASVLCLPAVCREMNSIDCECISRAIGTKVGSV